MVVHCLFEQSGTFRDEFRKLGYKAYDYDRENQFGKTDFPIDLFREIEKAVNKESSVFDTFTDDDLIIAFFPCIRFIDMCLLTFTGASAHGWSLRDKIIRSSKLSSEQSRLYGLFCSLFLIAEERNFKLIVENPYSTRSYLVMHFPIKASIIDNDRRLLGDKFKKPTQYWFFNCRPYNNKLDYTPPFIFGNRLPKLEKDIKHTHNIDRSLIGQKYAENFIKKYVLKGE